MSLRSKLFISMLVLILSMTGVYFVMSRAYTGSAFQKYASAVRQSEAQQWSGLLANYYQNHGNKWTGVSSYVRRVESNHAALNSLALHELLLITNARGRAIYFSPIHRVSKREITSVGIPVSVVVDRKRVATVYVFDRGLDRLYHLQQRLLGKMTQSIIVGAVVTMGVALLLALWLSRVLTNPLNQLMRAIREMGRGNLKPRLSIASGDEFGQVSSAFNHMANQLSAAEEARRHLVADVAHELRTPLTIMQGQLELVQQGVQKPDTQFILSIYDECIRLSRLVGDLHQLSLAEAGVLPLEREETDVAMLLERIVDNFQVEAEDKGVHLSLHVESKDVTANVDPNRITQVFINLIGNAVRYTPSGREVKVLVAKDAMRVQVMVSDTGAGIAPDHLPSLFDRFYRVDADRNRERGGMGLGLAIAKEFVEAHGGEIQVNSTLGKGTTFTVLFPVTHLV